MLASNSINALLENTVSEDELVFEINLKENIKAPIEQGDNLGTVSYMIDGIQYETNLIASHSVEKSKLLNYILEIGIGFLIIILVYKMFFHKRKKKRIF